MRSRIILLSIVAVFAVSGFGQSGYKKPPKTVQDILDAKAIPTTSVSPARDRIALFEPLRYPPVAELAEPMLRLAGLRINPKTNAQHRQNYVVSIRLKNISDGRETPVSLPAGAKIISPQWSPDGKYIAVGNITPSGIELWFIDTATARASKVRDVMINTAFGGFSWVDTRHVSANLVPKRRGAAPQYQDIVPNEPNIQETVGRTGAIQTFQDLLRSPNDERLFEYYATSQPALIDVSGKVREIGSLGIYNDFEISPDGKFILTSRIQKPFSYQFPSSRFPRKVEIWDPSGKLVHAFANIPLQDNLPSQGVPIGPRSYGWIPTESATLIWAEALDGGDPRTKITPRDKLMTLAAPFTGGARELLKIEHRYQGRAFGERDGMMLFFDFNRDTLRRRIFMTDYRNGSNVKMVSDLNIGDRYNAIGNPVTKPLMSGSNVIHQSGDWIYLTGPGSSPQGDRPFLRKLNLKTLQTEEIFRSSVEEYEPFVAMVDDEIGQFITRKDSPTEPPNLFLRQVCPQGKICTAMAYRPLTEFGDPSPQLRGITKQLVQYKRDDGVDLSFTLYLPPGYKEGTRLPTVVWAYPQSFTDGSLAGQVAGSTNRFTQIGGPSHLFFLMEGYAVLDGAAMPIVGPPETKNDTFVKQIVNAAQAAVDKGVEMGVVDPDRVGVGGHSYGAFMTANLLAHSDIFRAGIARSGAYNRSLTPFGFQDERRTFWEATNIYTEVSPFFYANKINEPILFIHGEADNNTGTYPIQSERLYDAVSGLGGTARLVMLPHESHGYVARESTEHTLYEMLSWFDKYVKNAGPRSRGNVGGK